MINAIQYSKSGKITIKLYRKSGKIEFSIEDQGVGIPPSELKDIFGAFTVSTKTKSASYGRGVGLALCKKAIEMHGGQIWAESDGEQGSIFSFNIPV